MNEHTPEPWELFPMGIQDIDVVCKKPLHYGTFLGLNCGSGAPAKLDADDQAQFEANARRIVACVNACKGIETETLENAGPIIDLIAVPQKHVDHRIATARADAAEAALAEAVGLLPPPDKLETLANWIDVKYPDDDDPEVQMDLRRWAHDIRTFLAAQEGKL